MFTPIHSQIGHWAQRFPDRLAVADVTTRITYRQLHESSNRLAHLLQNGHRLGPGHVAAVLVQNTVSSIVALVAVLKTGAAYLPLDQTYPAKRQQLILAESGASLVVLTGSDNTIATAAGIPFFSFDLSICDHGDASDISTSEDRQAVAYVIYTSGSTGKPKGVAVAHEALANNIEWAASYYGSVAGELHSLLHTSLSFDGSATTYWAPLTSGGTVTLVERGNVDALLKALARDEQINFFKTTPSSLAALLDLRIIFRHLRVLVVAGEAFPSVLARRAQAILGPRVTIFNSYGPSEATINCLVHRWTSQESTAVVPIGKPIPSCFAAVLDESGQRLIGQPGQLVVGGLCLARGYHRTPEFTAEKFKCLASMNGERVYFTGDRVLQDADGIFYFFGRMDLQRKLRGYRIDLAEVELALMEQGCFEDVVVEVEGDESAWLVASVVPKPNTHIDSSQLRGRLREFLPEPMVPQRWYRLEKMPIDPHGKKDRAAASKSPRSLLAGMSIEHPKTATEQLIVSLLEELLGHEVRSVDSKLDEFGIDSIRRMMLAARIENRTGKRLAPSQLRPNATPAQIARMVAGLTVQPVDWSFHAMPPLPDGAAIPFTLAQQSYFDYLQRQRARQHETFDNLFFAGILQRQLDLDAFTAAVNALVDRHELLRSVPEASPGGSMVFARMSDPKPSLEVLELPENAKDRRSKTFQQAVSDIVLHSNGSLVGKPLFRAVLIPLNGLEYGLILVVHILICDGWAKNLLLRELHALYTEFSFRRGGALPSLATNWRDYAAWERQRFLQGGFASHLQYWCEHLKDSRPVSLPRIASNADEQGMATLSLPEEACAEMARLISSQAGGKFGFHIHCLAVLIFFYTDHRDLVIGVLAANRPALAFETIFGPFVTVIFPRFQIDPHSSFRQNWLKAVEVCEAALDHQDIPLPLLSQALSAQGTTSVSQTRLRFNLGNHPQSELLLEGLTVHPISAPHRYNDTDGKFKFDVAAEASSHRISLRYDGLGWSLRKQFLEDYSRLFQAAIATPDSPLADFAHTVEGAWRE